MRQIDDPEDPRLPRIHAARLIKRDIDQLLGICEFALQDGHIDQSEAESILAWLNAHPACLDTWPANVLYDRLCETLADGVLDEEEQRDLLGTVLSITRPRTEDCRAQASTLPIDTPPPKIVFAGKTFCLTGVFDYGPRAKCQAAILERGGIPNVRITKRLHYLVIGNIGSEMWRHSSFGSKIAKAMAYRKAGESLAIISEKYWAEHLK